MTIAQIFNREIEGEKLFYTKKGNFTDEEANLVFDSVYRRVRTNLYYTSMITSYIPVLETEILPKIDKVQKKVPLELVELNLKRHHCLYHDKIGEEYDFGQYSARENYGIGEHNSYFKAVVENVMDAEKVEDILKSKFYGIYPINRDFLITANFLFVRYPSFYNDEYVERLKGMIDIYDERCILDKGKKKEFISTEKITLKHIKRYYKERKKENKQLKKVKKI